jgi:twitching motility two-component system response regulator PilG
MVSTPDKDELRSGVVAARAGDREMARQLFLQVVENEPRNESSWMWLARLSDTPEAALECLEKVLEINPKNEKALEAIITARLQVGITAVKAGRKSDAYILLQQVVDQDPDNETAWLWLASTTDSAEKSLSYLERVLELDPDNDRAKEGIEYFQARLTPSKPAWQCFLCQHMDEHKQILCPNCGCVLSLNHLDRLLGTEPKDVDAVKDGIGRLIQKVRRKPDFLKHCYLGIAYLNLRQFDEAIGQLLAALRLKEHPQLREQVTRIQAYSTELTKSNKVAQEQIERQQPSVLLVSSSATIRNLFTAVLERAGYQVQSATDAVEANLELDMLQPDIAIIDVDNVESDGFQLCRQLHNQRSGKSISTILLSGGSGIYYRMKLKWSKPTASIAKPVSVESLLDQVRSICPANSTLVSV